MVSFEIINKNMEDMYVTLNFRKMDKGLKRYFVEE